jgi:hypothetical protein
MRDSTNGEHGMSVFTIGKLRVLSAEERRKCMDMAVDWWLEMEKRFKKLE